jgi:hypothetical protein
MKLKYLIEPGLIDRVFCLREAHEIVCGDGLADKEGGGYIAG